MDRSPSYIDPDDPLYQQPDRRGLFEHIDQFLLPEEKRDVKFKGIWGLFLLADSGMGKTAFVVNYFDRKNTRGKYPIAVVRLGRPGKDAAKLIDEIANKENTTLFLDGFDEDQKAIEDYKTRFEELIVKLLPFRRIVITCRTQFFVSRENMPGLHSRIKSEGGEIREVYLAPFNNDQVKTYLKTPFRFWERWFKTEKWKRAKQLVANVRDLSVRPMLLSYIRDLIEREKPISKTIDVYEAIVDVWLRREHKFDNMIDPQQLYIFSKELAKLFHQDGVNSIYFENLEPMAKKWGFNFDRQKLTTRSLLNRDGLGNYMFAHRSILEYLYVECLLEEPDLLEKAELTDQMFWFLLEHMELSVESHSIKDYLEIIRKLDTNYVIEGIIDAFDLVKNLSRIKELKVRAFISRYIDFLPMLIVIPDGTFWMGFEQGRYDEKPRHQVHLTEYAIGRYPVTNEEYERFIKETGYRAPENWRDNTYPEYRVTKNNHPVGNVEWEDAVEYAKWLSQKTGWTYGLPTEAQWEKAAAGQEGYTYPWGNEWKEGVCNNRPRKGSGTTPVGAFSPEGDSSFGCSDMAGNVLEWCEDRYNREAYKERDKQIVSNPVEKNKGDRRVLRGESFTGTDLDGRCATRRENDPSDTYNIRGFRIIALSLTGKHNV